jgi:mRNA interferase RelE/StbE
MRIEVRKSFEKDISKISNKELAADVNELIEDLERCEAISEIPHLKKLSGKGNYYRIRVGNHRLGLMISEQTLILLRFMSRKDIYKYFP